MFYACVSLYLPSCGGRALRQAAGAVGELVLLQVHQGVALPLNVGLVDAVQGLQALGSHRVVAPVQRRRREAAVGAVGEPTGPTAPASSQGVVIPRELRISSRDHGTLSLLST